MHLIAAFKGTIHPSSNARSFEMSAAIRMSSQSSLQLGMSNSFASLIQTKYSKKR
jgi:hypothetical protein